MEENVNANEFQEDRKKQNDDINELKQKSKLRDSRVGDQATWPNWLGRYGIPIDYVLHSPEWQVVASKTQHLPGSDHRAIITDLQLNSCAL